MSNIKRTLAAFAAAAITAATFPAPAGAVSTSSEIRMGQVEAQQVDAENALMADPILNAWASGIESNLAKYRARPDITYTVKIIDTNEINAFSLEGGFIYVNFGLLNFVNSDDELAGVLGHETGHVERRHIVTGNAKAQVLSILLDVLSFTSPFVYRFGNLIGGLGMAKMSRVDELQADQYGLQLMTRAGYDPDAMLSFMVHMQAQSGGSGNGLDKYFEDHPDPVSRIAHLKGYTSIADRTTDQFLSEAMHDQDEGRYAFALSKFQSVLAKEPTNQLALLHAGQVDIALGSFDKSEIALTQVAHAHDATPEAASAASRALALLPQTNKAGGALLAPNLDPVRKALTDSIAQSKAAQTAIDARAKLAKDDYQHFSDRLNNLAYEVPNLGNVNIRPGSRLDGIQQDLQHMSKDINVLGDKTGFVNSQTSSMLKDDLGVLDEMNARVKSSAITGDTLRLLPFYGEMTDGMNASASQLVDAITANRGALALAWQSLPLLDAYFRQLSRTPVDFGGDISPIGAQQLKPLATSAEQALDTAANAASKAQGLYYSAQARQIQARITLLGVGYPQGRYDSLAQAVHTRLGIDPPTYAQVLTLGMSTGDVAVASWLAAEEKVPVSTVINEQRVNGKSFIDMALDKHLSQESLEVVLGLWWEGYTEKSA
ncbi:MAG TPA: M48 family metalloprotease [Candidatus Eremiobacteraceae bacterium]|nr:M48 family metalloprotease [Candidatus Eremiobacteraceae bacterium]